MYTSFPKAGAAARVRFPTAAPASAAAGGAAAAHDGGMPPPPPVPVVPLASHAFDSSPRKVIREQAQVDGAFLDEGGPGTDVLNFVVSLAEAARGTTMRAAECEAAAAGASPAVRVVLGALEGLGRLLDAVPPATHSLRYGNPAYRVWHDRMVAGAEEVARGALCGVFSGAAGRGSGSGGDGGSGGGGEDGGAQGKVDGGRASVPVAACAELAAYWCDSFGNRTRIDYGTGHETNFLAWLYCLRRCGALCPGDSRALVLCVFQSYLALMRRVQTTYWLEPAGSHGVWGLDDYQFLPFVFGAAQLADHKHLRPKSIHVEMTREAVGGNYMYFQAVEFVRSVKNGLLAETSPILNDVSAVSTWARVYAGMVRMYRAEVLSKVPIVQHFLFGSLIEWRDAPAVEQSGGEAS